MTTYFDTFSTSIYEQSRSTYDWQVLMDLEQALVFDVTVAAMQPDFPEDLRRSVHDVVLKYGITTLPNNAEPRDFEHQHEHIQLLNSLGGDLHSVFHAVANRCPHMGDSPRRWVRRFFENGEEEREALVESYKEKT